MKKKIVILLLIIFIGGLLFPFLTLAGDYQVDGKNVHYEGLVPCGKAKVSSGESDEVTQRCQFCHLFVMLDGIITFVLFDILPPVAVLMMVIAGVMFFFGGGNPSLLLQAKKLITSIVIGLVIIFSAYLIVGAVLSTTGVLGWTTLDKWLDNGVFIVDCPIGEGGNGGNGGNGENGDGEDEWSNAIQYDIEDPDDIICTPIDISKECEAGFKLNKAKCEPGDDTKVIESKQIVGKEGWYCKFQGKTSGWELCFPPKGTLYLDCIDDPDYVPSVESSLTTDPSGAEEQTLTLNCETGQTLVKGSCIITDPITTSITSEGSSNNGYFCTFFGINTAPGGKITIECTETPGPYLSQKEAITKLTELGIEVYNLCPNENCNDSVLACGGTDETYVCLNGLPSTVVDKLDQIKEACNCNILITGGTEKFGHDDNTPHGYGKTVVDLQDYPELENWFNNNSYEDGPSWCPQLGTGYELNDGSAEFCDEENHLHFELK